MSSSSSNDYIRIPIRTSEGKKISIFVQVSPNVNDRSLSSVRAMKEDSFDKAVRAISAIADKFAQGVQAAPTVSKAQVEFGLNFGFEAGELKILLVQGADDASLKVTLECYPKEESGSSLAKKPSFTKEPSDSEQES
jgi:hypothetical protein